MDKIPVGVLGATGMVGQKYLELLANHPWFEVKFLGSSDQWEGKSYGEAVQGRWKGSNEILNHYSSFSLSPMDAFEHAQNTCRFVFSAVSHQAAALYEEQYAAHDIPVITNVGFHRGTADVPVLIPEVNPQHASLISIQQKNRGWKQGFIVAKPNCSLQSFMIPLTPLNHRFKVKKLHVTTMQAISGAGYPGVSSIDILDNIIPYIPNEEEKSEQEPLKIWGEIKNGVLIPTNEVMISAHCNRVPVLDGHMACVSVEFEQKPKKEEIMNLWKDFKGIPQTANLPSAPISPLIYLEDNERPQPKRDRNFGNGMGISIGRLRSCPLFDYRFVALSHNVIRGAAGGGILNAELLVHLGYLK